jgi:hypothetical protein
VLPDGRQVGIRNVGGTAPRHHSSIRSPGRPRSTGKSYLPTAFLDWRKADAAAYLRPDLGPELDLNIAEPKQDRQA